MLSATLTSQLRAKLLDAYESGSRVRLGVPSDAKVNSDFLTATSGVLAYPSITTLTGASVSVYPVPPSSREMRVLVQFLADDFEELADLIAKQLVQGGAALVIRNTVSRAIETAAVLRKCLPFEVMLVHGRFTVEDRLGKDDRLRAEFGRGRDARKGNPIVVVATQVAEQSLDVDFDLLVSDLCPVDLLLQRVGRIHRHRETLPSEKRCSPLQTPTVWLTGISNWTTNPPAPVAGSVAVYGLYPLLRSLAALGIPSSESVLVRIPDDIRTLVEAAYGDGPLGPQEWWNSMEEARKSQSARLTASEERARTFRAAGPSSRAISIGGWIDGWAEDDSPGGQCQVRDGEAAVEVLLFRHGPDPALVYAPGKPFIDDVGPGFQWNVTPDDETARAILGCTVRLPSWAVQGQRGDRLIEDLERQWYPRAWQESPLLRGNLVLVLGADGSAVSAGMRISYSNDRGLEVGQIA